jgi:hypothetical protein
VSEEPQTPAAAAKVLWWLDEEARKVTEELRGLRLEMPALNRARREAYARSFLSTQGAEHFRKQTAELAASDQTFARDVCEQRMEACRDRLWELKGKAENVRAINSNLKEELRLMNGGLHHGA